MPRIRCLYEECVFLVKDFCIAPSIELDPEDGCLTYSEDSNILHKIDSYDDDEIIEDSWEDAGFEELDDLDFDEDN